jgi:hypothetical protein
MVTLDEGLEAIYKIQSKEQENAEKYGVCVKKNYIF